MLRAPIQIITCSVIQKFRNLSIQLAFTKDPLALVQLDETNPIYPMDSATDTKGQVVLSPDPSGDETKGQVLEFMSHDQGVAMSRAMYGSYICVRRILL